MENRFRPSTDYKTAFEQAVTELIDKNIEDMSERIRAINDLIDEFVLGVYEHPDPVQLDRLANYILHEELTDQKKNKARREEFPVFSERQLLRRRNCEVSEEGAVFYGNDGRNYRYPERRKRTIREMLFVDKKTKSRNKERLKRYREFTKPGEVISYFIKGTNKAE